VLHSIRVALDLERRGYSRLEIISAVLHDLLEDTDTQIGAISSEFGESVGKIVQAVSFDPSIEDKRQRDLSMFTKCVAAGPEAVRVKAADIIDNVPYVKYLGGEQEVREWRAERVGVFAEMARPLIGNEELWSDLVKAHKELTEWVRES
jgi:GTP pyrophosphokinase